jgi:hypothetical protein
MVYTVEVYYNHQWHEWNSYINPQHAEDVYEHLMDMFENVRLFERGKEWDVLVCRAK